MSKCNLLIWGREFSLDISYECYPDEKVLDIQREALESISTEQNVISETQLKIEEYILSDEKANVAGSVDNIFKYVMPKCVFIPRSKDTRCVVIMCDYIFDPEHGIAIVFENEHLKIIGTQDVIL